MNLWRAFTPMKNPGFVAAFWVEQITAMNDAHANQQAHDIVNDRIAFELGDYSGLEHTYNIEVTKLNF